MLLGTARLLTERRETFAGAVKLVFQPAEEGTIQGGGAAPMIEAGVLDDPPVDAAFGIHVGQYLPTGTIGIRAGPAHASYDLFTITVHGSGGHGSRPHQTVDAVYVGAQIVVALQAIVSRETDPREMAVVTVGSFQAGSAPNVIAAQATIVGSVRAFDRAVRDQTVRRVEEIARGVAAAHRAECTVDLADFTPVVVNDPGMAALAREVCIEIVGAKRVTEPPASTGSEDMAYFLERVPGCFFWVGCGNDSNATHPHHHPRFDLDEAVLPIGARALAAVALRALAADGK
jgi:amidohydrolase